MEATEAQARLTAALESLGDMRTEVVRGSPVDQRRYAAAIRVAGTALDTSARKGLIEIIPSTKATLDDLDIAGLYLSECLSGIQVQKATKAAYPRAMYLETRAHWQPAVDQVEFVNRVDDAASDWWSNVEESARWVSFWLKAGDRRLERIRELQETGGYSR